MSDTTPENVIVLDQPIVRGATTIDQITLRKPNAGALRGITLSDLLQMDVNAIVRVIPRISTPTLTEAEVRAMDPADLVDAGSVVASFFAQEVHEGGSLPRHVEDAMADLAITFHWHPAQLDQLSVSELMDWRERARKRVSPDGQ